MTAGIMHACQHAERNAVRAQQIATNSRPAVPELALTPVTVTTINQAIKRTLTVREYGAFLVAVRRG